MTCLTLLTVLQTDECRVPVWVFLPHWWSDALASYLANANSTSHKYYTYHWLPLQHFLFTVTFPVGQPSQDNLTKCWVRPGFQGEAMTKKGTVSFINVFYPFQVTDCLGRGHLEAYAETGSESLPIHAWNFRENTWKVTKAHTNTQIFANLSRDISKLTCRATTDTVCPSLNTTRLSVPLQIQILPSQLLYTVLPFNLNTFKMSQSPDCYWYLYTPLWVVTRKLS